MVGSQPADLLALAKAAAVLVLGERVTPAPRRSLGARAEHARGRIGWRAVRCGADGPRGARIGAPGRRRASDPQLLRFPSGYSRTQRASTQGIFKPPWGCLAKDDFERARVKHFNYASIVGALLYIAVMTRPDIAFHTSVLAKFLSDPSEDCCKAATQLMQYLHSTRDRKMVFNGCCTVPQGLSKHAEDIKRNHGFVAYSDSSWGNLYPYPMFGSTFLEV